MRKKTEAVPRVRLKQDHTENRCRQQERNHQIPQVVTLEGFIVLKSLGQDEDNGQLGELRGLQSEITQIQPTLGTSADAAYQGDQQEEQEDSHIKRVSEPIHAVVIDGKCHHHGYQTDGQPVSLFQGERAGDAFCEVPGGAVNGHDPDGGQNQGQSEQGPVEVRSQPPVNSHGSLAAEVCFPSRALASRWPLREK